MALFNKKSAEVTSASEKLARFEAAKLNAEQIEKKLNALWARVEKAYLMKCEGVSGAASEYIELSQDYNLLESEKKSALSIVSKLQFEYSDAIEAEKMSQELQKWKNVENAFPKMNELAEVIEQNTKIACQAYNELIALAHTTFNDIPEKDTSIFNDSPLGLPRIEGHFKLLLRRHGMLWAQLWVDDVEKIPSIKEAIIGAKNWAMKLRPYPPS